MSRPQESNGWEVVGRDVMPLNDLRPHTLRECWCKPVMKGHIIVHKSADGREITELAILEAANAQN